MLHPGFIDVVLKILRCACFFCSELLLTEKDKHSLRKNKDRRQRLAAAAAAGKSKRTCLACGGSQPVYSRQGLNIRCDWSKVTFTDPEEAQYCQRAFTATEVRLILQQMSDDACTLLALNVKTSRPENFVMTMLVVPPPIVRPSITLSEGSRARGQDDLTSKLCDIVKANATARLVLEKEVASIPKNGLSITAQQTVGDLAFHVSTFMNNEIRGQRQAMQRCGLPSKSITSRLKGKEGRIRSSLMGKRVNFSARSVVSPDSQMDIDQVGIPVRVAMKLTVPEKTTNWNIDRMRGCIRRGPRHLLGAHALVRAGTTTLLEFADMEKEAKMLKVGDIVERFLVNDDIVLFNRQPSLHKGSMMAYRVRIMPHKTFRLNMAVTLPLNADCDGDELNVHVPQDEESQTEARLLMAVPCQIVSPQANKPCIGFVQDAVIGSWLLTRDGILVQRSLAVVLWASIQHKRPRLPIRETYSGKEIYSLLFPPDLHYWNAKAGVSIKSGVLTQGRLCKMTLGATSGGIVHAMYLSHGPDRTAEFLSDAQRLVNRWLATRGFSIRLSDCEPAADTVEKVDMNIRLAEQKFERILQADAVACLSESAKEIALSDIANRVLTNVGKVVHASLDEDSNALYQAVLCASKGNLINVAQMLGCIGQTSVEGRRIFVADDQLQFGAPGTLAKCGFVANSYFSGLNNVEFFFHTMAGREGLIDTAVKTANTGYLQRRLMKAMETLTVCYDRTVRNARQNIVQFLYGADSYDATYLVRQPLTCLETPQNQLKKEFHTDAEWAAFWPCLLEVRRHRCRPQGEPDNLVYAPGSVGEVLHMVVSGAADGGQDDAPVTPKEHLLLLDALCNECCPTPWAARRSAYETILRWNLRYAQVTPLHKKGFVDVVAEMRRRSLFSLVAPGEAVGALSAQSISEPLTQLTLNTFHSAGIKGKNVTLGVPRIKELIDVTKNMKTPSMRLVVKPAFEDRLHELSASLVHCVLGDAVKELVFVREPQFFESAVSDLDMELASRERQVMLAPRELSEWVGRIVLDPSVLGRVRLSPVEVACKVASAFPLHVSASSDSDPLYILRLRPRLIVPGSTSFPVGSREEQALLRTRAEALVLKACRETVLGGMKNISGVKISKETISLLNVAGDFESERVTVMETQGGSLSQVLGMDAFRSELCTSNDVHDVYGVLGVEAAASVLFDQIKQTLQFDGSYTNERHLLLLCSFCAANSTLLPISRHGINRMADSGALSRASFEEVTDQLLEAALYGDVDYTTAFSPAIMVGQRACSVGTGICYTVPTHEPQEILVDSEDEVVFTSVDTDLHMISYRQDIMRIEAPYSDSNVGLALPATLQHSWIAALPKLVKPYAPSSPKTSVGGRKRPYTPSSPRGERREGPE